MSDVGNAPWPHSQQAPNEKADDLPIHQWKPNSGECVAKELVRQTIVPYPRRSPVGNHVVGIATRRKPVRPGMAEAYPKEAEVHSPLPHVPEDKGWGSLVQPHGPEAEVAPTCLAAQKRPELAASQ
eukprot:scaffold141_cov116-Cylindrotheca_fusiformis.AAC.1